MDAVFRAAGIADIELLVEFIREFYEFDRLTFDERLARTALRQILSDDALGRVWLIQTDGGDVGYVVLTLGFSLVYGGRDAFIDEFYIRAGHRGLGLGKKTLEFVEKTCRLMGVQALHLEVGRDNTRAQDVYRKFGLEDHGHHLMTKICSGKRDNPFNAAT
jgi:diamine N-acetyltransferase